MIVCPALCTDLEGNLSPKLDEPECQAPHFGLIGRWKQTAHWRFKATVVFITIVLEEEMKVRSLAVKPCVVWRGRFGYFASPVISVLFKGGFLTSESRTITE